MDKSEKFTNFKGSKVAHSAQRTNVGLSDLCRHAVADGQRN